MTPATLYIVATPIGNLKDISLRALDILRQVQVIAAEDTRHSKALLQHYAISTPLISLHNFNEAQRIPLLLDRLQQGESIALMSDAGTPLISDPGYALVKAVRMAGVHVSPIPGACAAIAALCASGLPTDQFHFMGFLPIKKSARQSCLAALQQSTHTSIFYEAPHRILDCMEAIITTLGADRILVLAKELTKIFETFFYGTAGEALIWLQSDAYHAKGEFVVLLQGVEIRAEQAVSPDTLRTLQILSETLPYRQAVELTAKITGENKNTLKKICFTAE